MRKSPRDRRLNSDFQSVQVLQQASGKPPQRYRLTFDGIGFKREHGTGRVSICNHHEVLVELGAAYPRMVPNLAWQTPIFHPNISNNGVVCLGGYGTHWVPSLTLSEMCTMLWDMIRYKNFDTESPYNREAALWAKQQTDFVFPIDTRSVRDRVTGEKQAWVVARRVDDESKETPQRTPQRNEVQATPVVDSGIEIIESGIEIIERRDEHRPDASDDGIVFLD
jgi:hypothetical protein